MDLSIITKKQLVDYLENAVELEMSKHQVKESILNIEKRIRELKSEINIIEGRRYIKPEAPEMPVRPMEEKASSGNLGKIWGLFAIGFIISGIMMVLRTGLLFRIGVSVLYIVAWVKTIKSFKEKKEVRERNSFADESYNIAVANYPIAVANYNKRMQEYNAACENDRVKKQELQGHIFQLEKTKNELNSKLNTMREYVERFYSTGIISPYYQGLEPMAKFFVYFSSGKCDTLKEAMLMYDEDVHRSKVEQELSEIKYGIGEICDTMQRLNSTVARGWSMMANSFSAINAGLNVMNENLNTQAYYAQITAECDRRMADDINTIRFYEDLKWIERYR